MGLITSRRSAGTEEPEVNTGNPYRSPPRSGKLLPIVVIRESGLTIIELELYVLFQRNITHLCNGVPAFI